MALKILFLATTPEGYPACQQRPRENAGEALSSPKPAQKSEWHPKQNVTDLLVSLNWVMDSKPCFRSRSSGY
jgi:hypothetical protein